MVQTEGIYVKDSAQNASLMEVLKKAIAEGKDVSISNTDTLFSVLVSSHLEKYERRQESK